MDTSDPDISLDGEGVCRYCRRAERLLPRYRWEQEPSERALAGIAEQIRKSASDQEYVAIIVLSGGFDRSYSAYLAHKLGLRPLAMRFDNCSNSELAVDNIQRVVEGCELDLKTYVIDWREFRD